MRKGVACLRCVLGVAVGDQVKLYVVGETILEQRRGHFGGELGAVGAEAFLIEANGHLVLRLERDNVSICRSVLLWALPAGGQKWAYGPMSPWMAESYLGD